MKTKGSAITAEDLMRAELVLEHVQKNMQIEFKLELDSWTRAQAQRSVDQQKALLVVRTLLLDTVASSIE